MNYNEEETLSDLGFSLNNEEKNPEEESLSFEDESFSDNFRFNEEES